MEIDKAFINKFGWDNFKHNPEVMFSSMKVTEQVGGSVVDDGFLPEVQKEIRKNQQPGFIVIHQNVGSLPPQKAEALCERVKNYFTNSKHWIDFKQKFPHWNFVLLPNREGKSFVEVFHENAGERKEIISEMASRNDKNKTPALEDTPELAEKVKNYVLLMLGAPAVAVALTESVLDFCYKHPLNIINDYGAKFLRHNFTHCYLLTQNEDFLCEGSLAHAMVIWGRTKVSSFLYTEGKEKLDKWKSTLQEMFKKQ